MKRAIGIVLVLISPFAAANLDLQVDPAKTPLGKPFRIVLTKDDTTPSGLPDLTPLQKDFSIISTGQSTNYSVVNGKASSTTQWILLLQPKHTGRLSIPAIRLGQETTQATSIEVTAADKEGFTESSDKAPKEVKLVTSVSTRHPFVNEQVIYTVKLYNRKPLADATFQAPGVTEALLVPLGDSKRYQSWEKGQLYLVEEQKYAIFPQHSGSLKITAPVFAALIYEDFPRQVKATTAASRLNVKPSPAGVKAQDWLPAKNVLLQETYDKNTASLVEGNTLVRTITLQATGLPAQLLPDISVANTGDFNVYSEKPIENNRLSQDNLVGTRSMKITYLFNKAGKTIIPAQTLKWFNTTTGKEETTSLPALTLNVAANLITPTVDQKKTTTVPAAVIPEQSTKAWWVAAGFAFLWLITLLVWWKGRRGPFSKSREKPVLKQLQEACQSQQPELAKVALLRWASTQWPDARLLSLTDVSRLTHDVVLQKQLDELTRALYRTNNKPWHGDDLWRCVSSFKKVPHINHKTHEPLPAIHPVWEKGC